MNVLRTTSYLKKKFEARDFERSKPFLLITLCVLKNIGSYHHLPPEIVYVEKIKWYVGRFIAKLMLVHWLLARRSTHSQSPKQQNKKTPSIIKDEKKQQVKLIIIRIHRP